MSTETSMLGELAQDAGASKKGKPHNLHKAVAEIKKQATAGIQNLSNKNVPPKENAWYVLLDRYLGKFCLQRLVVVSAIRWPKQTETKGGKVSSTEVVLKCRDTSSSKIL